MEPLDPPELLDEEALKEEAFFAGAPFLAPLTGAFFTFSYLLRRSEVVGLFLVLLRSSW
jgi:hypothetical protein